MNDRSRENTPRKLVDPNRVLKLETKVLWQSSYVSFGGDRMLNSRNPGLFAYNPSILCNGKPLIYWGVFSFINFVCMIVVLALPSIHVHCSFLVVIHS